MDFIPYMASGLFSIIVSAVVVVVAVIARRAHGAESASGIGKAVRRALEIAWVAIVLAVAAYVLLGWAMIFWLLSDTDLRWWTCFLNCERPDCGWIEGNGVRELMGWVAFQAALLVVTVAGLLLACQLIRKPDSTRRGLCRRGWRGGVAVWAAGVAVTALVDLGIYIHIWVSWARCRVDSYRETFAFPTRQVVEGSLAAGTVAALATVLARRMGRSASMRHPDRGGSPHSA